jgi:hypothetical protein
MDAPPVPAWGMEQGRQRAKEAKKLNLEAGGQASAMPVQCQRQSQGESTSMGLVIHPSCEPRTMSCLPTFAHAREKEREKGAHLVPRQDRCML